LFAYSDEEIRELMYNAIQKGLAENDIVKKYEIIGEKQAYEEILEARRAERIRSEKAEEGWPDMMHQLQNEAVLNLKTSITPNAQLIAAILEEEGDLTEDELSGWCDELASLPENGFRQLLNGMVDEKVISRKEGKYHLLNICTPSLFPEDIEWFMQERLSDNAGKKELEPIEFKVMDMLSAVGAKTAYSIPSYMKTYAEVYPDEVLNENNFQDLRSLRNNEIYGIHSLLRRLVGKGLLHRYRTSDCTLFYFPMLGLKEDE